MLKRAKIFIICFLLIILSLIPSFSVSAAIIEKGIITIGTVSGNTGDTVIVPITIAENPGISGITISITYDSSALEFVKDIKGNVLYEYQTKAHPTRNIIRLVTSEQGNRNNNGTMLSLEFKIAAKAPAKLYKIDINYSKGDFCNWQLDSIMPKIISGGVDVKLSKSNCTHKTFTAWSVATIPSCLESGAEKRSCTFCGHVELRDTAPIGHEFSKDFTIDKEATKTESGLMSRHCIRCKEYTDQISYTLKDSNTGNIENKFDTVIPSNDYIDKLNKEQNPDSMNTIGSDVSSNNQSQVSSNPQTNNSSQEDGTTNSETSPQNKPTSEKEDTNKTSVLDKIKEAFPNFELIVSIFAAAIIIILIFALV